MAAVLGSAVASEAVNRLSSIIISGSAGGHENDEERAERLEMAVLKIQSVAAVSEDWEILHRPLLNWKAKLKRVGKEGDAILLAYRSRATEPRRDEQQTAIQEGSLARRIIRRAAKRFKFMPFARGEQDNLTDDVLRRFERVANGADEFFRYVQLGGRPKKSLVYLKIPSESILAGRSLEVSLRKGSQDALMLLQPWHGETTGGRNDAILFLSYDDAVFWEKNARLCIMFSLSGSNHIDIMGTLMTCLDLLPPQFGAASVTIEEFVREVLSKDTSFSDPPSVMSAWCGTTARECHRCSTEPSADEGCSSSKLQLPWPIIRVDAECFALQGRNASGSSAIDSLPPLKLICHITPELVPNKFSNNYEKIEPQRLPQMLPQVTNASFHEQKSKDWWCPNSCTFVSVEPLLSVPPPTLRQLFAIENSETPVPL